MFHKKSIAVMISALGLITAQQAFADAASGTVWTKWLATQGSAEAANFGGSYGSITFNDWAYIGPGGRNASQYAPINGFGGIKEGNALDPAGGIGQLQRVVTRSPDWRTPDAPQKFGDDFGGPADFSNANSDTGVNFYQWGYSSPGGSTFNNMLIDYDGDYLVKQNDMRFKFYNYFDYQQELDPVTGTKISSTPDGRYYTSLAFQPYTLSDATGWCGSVLAQHPGALEAMAGQIKFDFAFDVYTAVFDAATGEPVAYNYMSTEVISDFEMGSYGDITVNVYTPGGVLQSFTSRAVVNNTSPDINNDIADSTAPVEPSQFNLVSFSGAGVIPSTGACGIPNEGWDRFTASGAGTMRFSGLIDGVTNDADCVAAGGEWQVQAFAGFAFILRADGIRIIEAIDYTEYPNTADAFLTTTDVSGNLVAYNSGDDGSLVTIEDLRRDTDGDGFTDIIYDNCTLIANDQLDTDADGYGNICDADFNNDNIVNVLDLGLFKTAFFSTGNVQEDLNGDQIVNSLDIGLFKGLFFTTPGPSGVLR